MESLAEFKNRIKGVNGPRKHKVRNSLGVYDAFKYYRKNKPDDKRYIMSESQYFSIIRKVNNLFADELTNGNDVKLPIRMGTLELRRLEKYLYVDDDGNIHTNMPIDWDRTLELWYNDEDARESKTLLRIESNDLFRLYYDKNPANYINKSYYEFSFNKDLKLKLNKNIRKGYIDAPKLERRSGLW